MQMSTAYRQIHLQVVGYPISMVAT